jgi:hypothetical protein
MKQIFFSFLIFILIGLANSLMVIHEGEQQTPVILATVDSMTFSDNTVSIHTMHGIVSKNRGSIDSITFGEPLEFETQDFTDWDTRIRGGSQPKLVFTPHTNGGITARAENGRMVYEILGGPDNYRSEHCIQEHLVYGHDTYREQMSHNVQYAVAYPVEINVWRNYNNTPGVVADLGKSGIIFQWHDPYNVPPPLCIKQNNGVLQLIYWKDDGPSENFTLATDLETRQRYNLVIAYKKVTGQDHIQVWVDGKNVHDRVSDAFFRSSYLYIKQGLYWTGRTSYQRGIDARVEVHMSGYAQFSGKDAIAAAMSRVVQ